MENCEIGTDVLFVRRRDRNLTATVDCDGIFIASAIPACQALFLRTRLQNQFCN